MKWLILTLGLLTSGCSISLYSHPVDSPMTVDYHKHRTTVYQAPSQPARHPATARAQTRPRPRAVTQKSRPVPSLKKKVVRKRLKRKPAKRLVRR